MVPMLIRTGYSGHFYDRQPSVVGCLETNSSSAVDQLPQLPGWRNQMIDVAEDLLHRFWTNPLKF